MSRFFILIVSLLGAIATPMRAASARAAAAPLANWAGTTSSRNFRPLGLIGQLSPLQKPVASQRTSTRVTKNELGDRDPMKRDLSKTLSTLRKRCDATAPRLLSTMLVLAVALGVHTPQALAVATVTEGFRVPMTLRYFFAGGVCASLSHTIVTPIDVVKTRQQTDPARYEGLSIPGVFAKISREEGPGMLLQGLAPTAVGYMLEGAMKFGVYEALKPIIATITGGKSRVLDFLLASIAAGQVAAIALCPAEAARIRMVADPKYATGVLDAFKKMATAGSGGSVLFRGLTAQTAKQVPYTIAKQMSFDLLKRYFYHLAGGVEVAANPVIKWSITFGAALTAALISTIASQPGDMILSEVNKDEKGMTAKEAIRDIIKKDGIAGLFRGLNARIMHVGTIVTIQLVVYDLVKQACGIPATGSR